MYVDLGCAAVRGQTTAVELCPKRRAFDAKVALNPDDALPEDAMLNIHDDGKYLYKMDIVHRRSRSLCAQCQEIASKPLTDSERAKAKAVDRVSGYKRRDDYTVSPLETKNTTLGMRKDNDNEDPESPTPTFKTVDAGGRKRTESGVDDEDDGDDHDDHDDNPEPPESPTKFRKLSHGGLRLPKST